MIKYNSIKILARIISNKILAQRAIIFITFSEIIHHVPRYSDKSVQCPKVNPRSYPVAITLAKREQVQFKHFSLIKMK